MARRQRGVPFGTVAQGLVHVIPEAAVAVIERRGFRSPIAEPRRNHVDAVRHRKVEGARAHLVFAFPRDFEDLLDGVPERFSDRIGAELLVLARKHVKEDGKDVLRIRIPLDHVEGLVTEARLDAALHLREVRNAAVVAKSVAPEGERVAVLLAHAHAEGGADGVVLDAAEGGADVAHDHVAVHEAADVEQVAVVPGWRRKVHGAGALPGLARVVPGDAEAVPVHAEVALRGASRVVRRIARLLHDVVLRPHEHVLQGHLRALVHEEAAHGSPS
mmetsp:Transcript_19633/g.59437  ORF Transcript_19633/g.59437 Transcript_19633/m.59437 type:complete len:274 (+) Transcript_19633:941-1762(+)